MTRFIGPMFALLLLIAQPARAATEADMVVYGSTPGGFCAAIAAAREGASIILLEPTDHVGAMSTGGLSHCDSNQMVRSTLMGLFDEWHIRVVKDYTDRGLKAPYDPAVKDQSLWVFEPHVALRVTKKMLDEAGVTVPEPLGFGRGHPPPLRLVEPAEDQVQPAVVAGDGAGAGLAIRARALVNGAFHAEGSWATRT